MKDVVLFLALVAAGGLVLSHTFTPDVTSEQPSFLQSVASAETPRREVMIDKRIAVRTGEELYVDIEHSDLIVEHGSNTEAHVRVVLEGSNMERAREYYESLNFKVDDSDAGISIKANRKKSFNWNWNSSGKAKITTYVTLPTKFDFDLSLSHGSAEIPDTDGEAAIKMSHGDLDVSRINGRNIEITLSHGDFEARELIANLISLRSSHGNISVGRVEADEITAKLSHGDVRMESVAGAVSVENSHGDINVRLLEGAESRFSNSHGDINIAADNNLAADIDFRGGDVNVASAFKFDGTVKKSQAQGRINGGGAEMVARTSHGSVTLRRK